MIRVISAGLLLLLAKASSVGVCRCESMDRPLGAAALRVYPLQGWPTQEPALIG